MRTPARALCLSQNTIGQPLQQMLCDSAATGTSAVVVLYCTTSTSTGTILVTAVTAIVIRES
jgi:hypothetical protein